MSDQPPPISNPPAEKNPFQSMARASWIAPLIGLGVNIVLLGIPAAEAGPVRGLVALIFFGGGLLLGIIALFGMIQYGRKGILIPALIGVVIPVALAVLALPAFYAAKRRAQSHPPPQPAVHVASALVVTNDLLRFSIDIPEGFRDLPAAQRPPNSEHVYLKGVVAAREAMTVINIERLDGTLPKNKPMKKEDMPPGFTGEVTTRNWRGLNVDTVVTAMEKNGLKMVVYAVQVPLRPAAIQLNVAGPESKRAELSQLTDSLLASLEGETNW
jgi:hypothetical protein